MVTLTGANLLDDDTLLEAGHPLWCSEFADEYEQQGNGFGAGVELTEIIDPLARGILLPIMRRYEQKLAAAWGRWPRHVFTLMSLDESDYADALYLTLMACRGHGVGLEDDFQEGIDQFERTTSESLDTSPIHTELTDLAEVAYELLAPPLGK
jgi:hypothetical protein